MTRRASPFPKALHLVYVVDVETASRGRHLDKVLGAGVTCLWLRDPDATGRALYEAAGNLLLRCRRLGAALLVGDRVDVAQAVGADGVQLGFRSVPAPVVRSWYGGWIGVSCHEAKEIAAAQEAGADHVVVSPVFGVPRKGSPLGVAGLRTLLEGVQVPAVALGGISSVSVDEVRSVPGVAGVAVIRALLQADDAEEAARNLSSTVTPR